MTLSCLGVAPSVEQGLRRSQHSAALHYGAAHLDGALMPGKIDLADTAYLARALIFQRKFGLAQALLSIGLQMPLGAERDENRR